jgi:hypothetical protein
MWAYIKKFLNSTLGKSYFEPLDLLDEKRAYKTYTNLKKFISPPIKQLGIYETNYENYSLENFIEPGIEYIENAPSRYTRISVLFIPNTVKNIKNNEFHYMYGTVVIDNKSGNINGYPWGHQNPERILFLRD